jgi:predicted protein tyrosine phosphatase
MVRRIFALSRIEVGNLINHFTPGTVTTQSILISISTTHAQKIITSDNHRETLRSYGVHDWLELSFADVYPHEFPVYLAQLSDPSGHALFSHEHARAIVSFVDRWKDREVDRLLAHCDMGKSRSGAVIAWAYHYLSKNGLAEWTQEQFWGKNPRISPNRHVARVLCEVSGLEYRESDY